MINRWRAQAAVLVTLLLLSPAVASATAPAEAAFRRADLLIEGAIEQGQLPGAVLLAGQGERVVYRKAFGSRAVQPQRVAMTADTVFDLASLSKPVGCATSIMLL